MGLVLPNPAQGRPDFQDDMNDYIIGLDNDLIHAKGVDNSASNSVTSTTYASLSTPDRVSVWANGQQSSTIVVIDYIALWAAQSGSGNMQAAIFLSGSDQVKQLVQGTAAANVETAATAFNFATSSAPQWIVTDKFSGLVTIAPLASTVGPIATTGTVIGGKNGGSFYGGSMRVFLELANGSTPFDVEVKYKVTAGQIGVSSRKLFVRAVPGLHSN